MGARLANKRILITGANGGLGLSTATQALQEGATVIFACRTTVKAKSACAQALATSSVAADQAIAAGGFDMLHVEEIDAAVDALPSDPFDVVFLQAGGWVWADAPQRIVSRGVPVERTVMKNVVGAHATLRALMRTNRLAPGARVVMIGGEGARGIPGAMPKPEFEDVAAFERYLRGDLGDRSYVPVHALGVAKLCAALWTRHLARRREQTTANFDVLWFTPGFIAGTGGTAGMPAWKEFLVQRLVFPLLVLFGQAQWPDAAAAKCVDCLAGHIGKHGDLLGAPDGKALGPLTDQIPMHALFSDAAFQEALFRQCEAAGGALPLTPSPRIAANNAPLLETSP